MTGWGVFVRHRYLKKKPLPHATSTSEEDQGLGITRGTHKIYQRLTEPFPMQPLPSAEEERLESV